MRIVILTLSEQRDKVVDQRIAKALADMGHEAMVRSFAIAGVEAVTTEKPDVVVLPMIGSDHKLNFARQCKEWGIITVVRRGEAGAAREVLDKMDANRVRVVVGDYDYSPYVDLELTWGPEFTEILAERGKMPRDKMVACGPFTLDACLCDHARAIYSGKRRILFATAWSGADDDPEYTECGLPHGNPLQRRMYDEHCAGRKKWIEAIRNLVATKSHKYTFALKVRPGESTSAYRDALPKDVQILPYEYPSSAAIAQSDAVIHAGSTMAIEAHLMGVPSINFVNCNPDPRLADICPRAEDFGELVELLGHMSYGQSNIDKGGLAWLAEHLYGPMDGKACQRAAEAIDKLAPSRRGRNAKSKVPDTWPRDLRFPTDDTAITVGPEHHRAVCPSCKNSFGIKKESTWAFCPFCGLTIRKIIRKTAEA